MDNVITATGKKFKSDYLVTLPDKKMLFVRVLETTKQRVDRVFRNPKETKILKCGGKKYIGYTGCTSIFEEGDALKVVLEYGIDNNSKS